MFAKIDDFRGVAWIRLCRLEDPGEPFEDALQAMNKMEVFFSMDCLDPDPQFQVVVQIKRAKVPGQLSEKASDDEDEELKS